MHIMLCMDVMLYCAGNFVGYYFYEMLLLVANVHVLLSMHGTQ